jgi:small-conductance mechanosensitive channel
MKIFPILVMVIWTFNPLWGQNIQPATVPAIGIDSSNQQKLSLKALAEDQQKQSTKIYLHHKQQMNQGKRLVELSSEIQKVKIFLESGFEYKKVMDLLSQVTEWKEIAVDGVITNRDSLQSTRNLTATSILLNELASRVDKWEIKIKKYHNTLGIMQYRIDSLAQDSVLYQLPDDPASELDYFQKLNNLKSKLIPLNASISGALDSIQYIELQVGMLRNSLESGIGETELLRKQQDEKIDFKEVASMREMVQNKRSMAEIIAYSKNKADLLIAFYLANHLYTILLMILTLISLATYLKILTKRSKAANIFEQLLGKSFALNHPVASATLVTICIFQFFLPLPPFIVTSFFWIACSIALTFIIRKSISQTWFYAWLLYLLLLFATMLLNFILLQSEGERMLILCMSITGVVGGIYLVRKLKRKVPNQKLVFTLLIIVIVYEAISVLLNLFGNYNYSKGSMMNGYFTVVVAFMVYWTILLSIDIVKISKHFHQIAQDNKPQLSFEKTDLRLPAFLYLVLLVGWFILISRNTHTYQALFSPLSELFYKTLTIGKFDFTLQSVSIFFLVIFMSGVISKIVSFLTADVNIVVGTAAAKEPGSWLLLVRIAIITAGILLAFVSAGIPMDRMAVIIGALGVGIGFGMQPLVNSLIGGLIIAFEKPINVGDIVEISGQVGKMKSIGIRSSVVTTWDGADVIIPNGDLMTQHLVNWTMGNTKRRFEISVGVAYGTDLEKTKNLLMHLMKEDHRILKYPEPFVMVTEFNNSSVDLVLKFWVSQFMTGFELKSDLLVAIDRCFKEHNIIIPFPQRDVHVYPVTPRPEQKNEAPN